MITEKQQYAAMLFEQLQSKTEVARQMGISESSVRKLLKRYNAKIEGGDVPDSYGQEDIEFSTSQIPEPLYIVPPKSGVERFILCAAQSETLLHKPFWNNLVRYAGHLGAQIYVATFNYNKKSIGKETAKYTEESEATKYAKYYPEELRDYLTYRPIYIGESLIFCAEMNTLPTAVSPLSGFESYTREKWGIFPHAKIQLKTIATAADRPSKQIMTTGAITLPNYVMKRAGIKAHFHHQHAAIVVELAADGSFWCRHIVARDEDGTFYDLDKYVDELGVHDGNAVYALNWGDIHVEKLDPTVAEKCWGIDAKTLESLDNKPTPLVTLLKPEYQFVHDLVDFEARNHHNISDPHFIFQTYTENNDSVESNLRQAAKFLNNITQISASHNERVCVVISNHDNALVKWLKNPAYDFKVDPRNAVFYLETQLAYYKALESKTTRTFYEDCLDKLERLDENIEFIHEDESHVAHGIEFGMHGHLGANGGKGSTRSYTRMGFKTNTGHTHSPEIFDGAYVAGVSGKLDMGYNKGLSSWAHAHIVTYQNGARAILTAAQNGCYFADQK